MGVKGPCCHLKPRTRSVFKWLLISFCILLCVATVAIAIYGLTQYSSFLALGEKSKSYFFDAALNKDHWSALDLGLRFVPPFSFRSWIYTGCVAGNMSNSDNNNQGCYFWNLGNDPAFDDLVQDGPFYLLGSIASPTQEPLSGVILTSLSITLVAGVYGLVCLTLHTLPHVPHMPSFPFFVSELCMAILDLAFLLAVLGVARGNQIRTEPSSYMIGFNTSLDALDYGIEAPLFFSPSSLSQSSSFRMQFNYTLCGQFNNQLAWLSQWRDVFNNDTDPNDAAFWEICAWQDIVVVDDNNCIQYACNGSYVSRDKVQTYATKAALDKVNKVIGLDAAATAAGIVSFILWYAFIEPFFLHHNDNDNQHQHHHLNTDDEIDKNFVNSLDLDDFLTQMEQSKVPI